MHILLLNDDSLPTARGGAAVIAETLRKEYEARGHRVTFVTTHQDSDDIQKSGNTISLPSQYNLSSRHSHCIADPKMATMLSHIFEECKPDAVHAHNIHTHLTYESLLIAKKHTNSIVLTAHDTFLVSFGRVQELRKLHVWDHIKVAGRKYRPLRNRAIRNILQESGTKVISISNAVDVFLKLHNITTAGVIPNGIGTWEAPSQKDIDAFKAKYHLTGPTVLFIGRIRADKGIATLLKAAETVLKQEPKTQFLVNGVKEDLNPFLENLSKSVRDAVVSTGWITREEARISYFASDIVTVPSIYLDNFPTVNLEAMAAAKPIVGTCFGGTPEAVLHNKTGIIVDPTNTELFASALFTLLKDSSYAAKLGKAGQERVRSNFTIEKQATSYLALLTE